MKFSSVLPSSFSQTPYRVTDCICGRDPAQLDRGKVCLAQTPYQVEVDVAARVTIGHARSER